MSDGPVGVAHDRDRALALDAAREVEIIFEEAPIFDLAKEGRRPPEIMGPARLDDLEDLLPATPRRSTDATRVTSSVESSRSGCRLGSSLMLISL
jgi:hypothetical protein